MKKNIKYVAMDMDNQVSKDFLETNKSSIYEIDSEFMEYGVAGFGGYMDVAFSGQLAEDPTTCYERKQGQSMDIHTDKLKDPKWKVVAYVISPVKQWYDNTTNEWKVITAKAKIVCACAMDKKKLLKLHKGDSISGKGVLRTYSSKDTPNGEGYWFIEVENNSLAINAYKTIRQGATDFFEKSSVEQQNAQPVEKVDEKQSNTANDNLAIQEALNQKLELVMKKLAQLEAQKPSSEPKETLIQPTEQPKVEQHIEQPTITESAGYTQNKGKYEHKTYTNTQQKNTQQYPVQNDTLAEVFDLGY